MSPRRIPARPGEPRSRSRLGAATLLSTARAGSPEWYAARARRLGASELAAVLGLSPWQSPFSLYHLKAGNVEPEPDKDEMDWGREWEAMIARRFARRHSVDGWKVKKHGLYVNSQRDYQVAQPDRVIYLGGRRMAALECKTDRYADDWGAEGSDDIPIYYKIQAMWQMDTFQWPECHVAVLITGVDYREYLVRYDLEEAEILRKAAVEFLARIDAGEPPSIDTHTATYRAVRQLHPDIDDVTVELDGELAAEYLLALAHSDQAEEFKTKASARVLEVMGRARRAKYDGKQIAIRVPTKGAAPHLRPAGNGRRKKAAAL